MHPHRVLSPVDVVVQLLLAKLYEAILLLRREVVEAFEGIFLLMQTHDAMARKYSAWHPLGNFGVVIDLALVMSQNLPGDVSRGQAWTDVRTGLSTLAQTIKDLGIKSIAVPPLGCGLGGLRWDEVRPMIISALEPLHNVKVLLFEPAGAPAAAQMKTATARPQMTIGRAALIRLIDRYKVPGYDYLLSLLEVHKLAYLLQCAGQPLKLAFQKGIYGPYADNLRHVLIRIEGHFISGYGDGKNSPETPLALLPGAAKEAETFLTDHPQTQAHFDRVAEVIDGFETPYGMELLSSVHWIATKEDPAAKVSADAAVTGVLNWNERKRTLFKPAHIRLAWSRLKETGWL
jgi:O-acetyl-ADP-ribose deacetylase (regulator of RNase III)